jgi:hypothetical protein
MSAYKRLFLGCLWEDDLPRLNFEEIQSQAGVCFNEDAQKCLRWAVGIYLRDLQAQENIPSKEVKRALGKIVDACDLLSEYLPQGGGFVDEENAQPVRQAVEYHSIPPVLELRNSPPLPGTTHPFFGTPGDVARFLNEWASNAKEALDLKGGPGRTRNTALRGFVERVRAIYEDCGGEGRGCYRDRATGEARGALVELVVTVLRQAGDATSPDSVVDCIMENPA